MTDPTFSREHRLRAARARKRARDPEALLDHANLDLPRAARAKVLQRLDQMPLSFRRNYLTAMAGQSPTAGIKAFCLMCVDWERPEVALCTDPACPLYPYRAT